MILYESKDFEIVAPDRPHVSRTDGGHLRIAPKVPVEDRTKLEPAQAIELMKLTMVAGEAMETVLTARGIPIGRINYQDNGNWKQQLHIHLYGRSRGAIDQKWGTPLVFPATFEELDSTAENREPLTTEDQEALTSEIQRLLSSDKYRNF